MQASPCLLFLTFFLLPLANGQCLPGCEIKVTIGVYYESLCKDSRAFITEQLYPTYQNLSQNLDVEFKPFGKASFVASDPEFKPEGGFNFTCQHGPKECEGNLYQACVLSKTADADKRMEFVNCFMTSLANTVVEVSTATQNCMEAADIGGATFEEVDKCHSSAEGENLLHDIGVETLNLDPPLYFVPWILLDEGWIKADFEAALKDLNSLMCDNKRYLKGVGACDA